MKSTAECGSEGESFLDLVSRAIRDSPTAKFVLDVDGDLPRHTSGIQAFCESVCDKIFESEVRKKGSMEGGGRDSRDML